MMMKNEIKGTCGGLVAGVIVGTVSCAIVGGIIGALVEYYRLKDKRKINLV